MQPVFGLVRQETSLSFLHSSSSWAEAGLPLVPDRDLLRFCDSLQQHCCDLKGVQPQADIGRWQMQPGNVTKQSSASEGTSDEEGWQDLSAFARRDTPLERCAASTAWQRRASSGAESASDGDWMDADETLIIFDWDDTLCPTSYIRADPRLSYDKVAPCFERTAPDPAETAKSSPGGSREDETEEEDDYEAGLRRLRRTLEEHASAVGALLRLATEFGRVVIVTLAKPEWVQDSIRNFMPSLDGLLEELGIDVAHARDTARPWSRRRGVEQGQDYGQILKTQTMAWVARRFYGTGRGGRPARSWKNVLSIGDSDVERLALQDVIFRRVQTDGNGNWQECRCKTLKLLEEPSVEQLTGQLESLATWLGFIARYDGDVDIDIGEALDDLDLACSPSPGQVQAADYEG